MSMLIYKDIPCYYELSWKPEIPAILFKIHKDFIKEKGNIPNDAPITMGLKMTFNLDAFSNDFGNDIGFGGVFKNCGDDNGFIKFDVDIPIIESKGGECEDCAGSGVDEGRDDDCLYCGGSGKKSKYDWKLSRSISATFTTLTTYLYLIENDTKCNFSQLLEIDTITKKGQHGGSLGGRFSISLVNWLKTFDSSNDIPEIREATIRAYRQMFCGTKEIEEHYFRVMLGSKNGRIAIDCPGDACGIHPEGYFETRDKVQGYEFACHNVDTSAQQLTLLVGLAALHDRARKEIK